MKKGDRLPLRLGMKRRPLPACVFGDVENLEEARVRPLTKTAVELRPDIFANVDFDRRWGIPGAIDTVYSTGPRRRCLSKGQRCRTCPGGL